MFLLQLLGFISLILTCLTQRSNCCDNIQVCTREPYVNLNMSQRQEGCSSQLQCLQSIENKIGPSPQSDVPSTQLAMFYVDRLMNRVNGMYQNSGNAWGFHCVTDDCIIMCFYFSDLVDKYYFSRIHYIPRFIAPHVVVLYDGIIAACCQNKFSVSVTGSIDCIAD